MHRDRTTGKAELPQPQPLQPQGQSLANKIESLGCALTAAGLAKILNVSKVTVFKQAKAGRIPSFRIGTCVRFCPVAVANWLRAQ